MSTNSQPREILPSRIKLAEFARSVWNVTPEHGTTFEDVCRDEYWQMARNELRVGDRIELIAEDGAWYAELIVLCLKPRGVQVGAIRHVSFEDEAEQGAGSEDFLVKWRSPRSRFAVMRKADGQVLKEGFDQKEEAQSWLADHLKTA